MRMTRRELMSGGLKGCTLLASGLSVPRFLSRSALAMDGPQTDARILVVLQLTGGNDGLNTFIPYQDDAYYRARPVLAVPRGQVLRLTDDCGVHPQMQGIKDLFDAGWVSVVQGVGYPNPNRSHFESMDLWHTCCAEPKARDGTGWLGRAAQRLGDAGAAMPAVHVDSAEVPLALATSGVAVPSLHHPDAFRLDAGGEGGKLDALRAIVSASPSRATDDLLFVQRTTLTACDQAERIAQAARQGASGASYPGYGLGEHLRLIANLISANLGARIYYTSLSGFDTHAKQRNHHPQLLAQIGQSLKAFFDDLAARKLADRVLVLTFSEFGRRVHENYSEGTDHGAAAPMMLVGPGVAPGVHGAAPNLTDLDDGDVRMQLDFRAVYASVLQNWLQVDPPAVLGRSYPLARILR
ncbi:MAG: hypothetical protein BroJett003_06480 [Planctomycetota bacterium]|nr:MAG: hypothetical protein BroJett003_06480 [Planctomycetota bacterium]